MDHKSRVMSHVLQIPRHQIITLIQNICVELLTLSPFKITNLKC
jgi:hypothetical protein